MRKINLKNCIIIISNEKKIKKKSLKILKNSKIPFNNLYIIFNFIKLTNLKNNFIFFFINKLISNKYNRKHIRKLFLPFYYFLLQF